MLNVNSDTPIQAELAVLTKRIEYTRLGQPVVIEAGTRLVVDVANSIGTHDGKNFDIFADEYAVLKLN